MTRTDYLWLLFLTIAVLAPLSEELLYRGYMMKVWAESAIGPVWGTLLVSLLWAATHLQYGLYEMAYIFVFGILLCVSRLKTDSIIPALAMHVSWNALSFIVLALFRDAF